MIKSVEKYLRTGIEGTPFCSGCGHGILSNAILRALDRLSVDENKVLFVSGIGCAGWIPSPHYNFDTLHTLHGRAVPFAEGAKRANPSLLVIVVSGDGDLLSIGGNHIIHAARRNTDITVICANNLIYGMTGGQTACTTPKNAITATNLNGSGERPFDACKLVIAAGAAYAARFPVSRPQDLSTAIERAILTPGFAFVEALSPCPTQYGKRNKLLSPSELYKKLDALCVSGQEASALALEKQKEFFIIGETKL